MARINLLTIHWGNSYGAIMQTMATCKILEELGHKVTVINLIHPKIKSSYKSLSSWTYLYEDLKFLWFKHRNFSKLTKLMFFVDAAKIPDADYTIVGSDQCWNRDITNELALSFFLDFASNTKRISLSTSFGKEEWNEDDEYTQRVASELNQFEALSVREFSGVNILKDRFNLVAERVIDPTIAFNKFDCLVSKKKGKKQIFCFLLGAESCSRDTILKNLATVLNLKVKRLNVIERRLKGGPIDWIDNIYNSEFVITDSFHGLAFCLMFHKNFVVFCADQRKFTRLSSLLKIVGLENRYINSIEDFESRKEELVAPINYENVDEVLHNESEKFKTFIKNNIK